MIEKYTLDNGVRVIMEKIPTVRSVALGIWVGTGSRYEGVHNNGISHFIEHMLFKGTENRTAKEIAESFDQIGGHVNAFTSKEYTCYYARVLDEHAPMALDTLADMFFHSVFDEGELAKEKNVVIEEIRMYDDTPDDLVHDLIAKGCFQEHSLGYSILGTESVLHGLTRNDLLQYVDQRYTPDRIVITVAGNYDATLLNKIQTMFSSFRRSGTTEMSARPTFTPSTKLRKKDTEQAHLCIAYPGLEIGHKDHYALVLMNNVLGGSMSSRLFQEVREERGLAYSVFSYHTAFRDNGMFTLYAGTAPKQLEEVYKVMMNTIDKLRQDGITPAELRKGKEQLKGSLMLSLESTNSRMNRLGKNELMLGKHMSLDEVIGHINDVSVQQIEQVIHRIFGNSKSIALVSPFEELPSVMQ